jgi:hypothetical protein
MVGVDQHSKGEPLARRVTVARIVDAGGAEYAEVTFLESARFYRLSKTNPGYQRYLALLKDARVGHYAVTVRLPSIDSDLIETVAVDDGAGR